MKIRARAAVIASVLVLAAVVGVLLWIRPISDPCSTLEVSNNACPGISVRLEVEDGTIRSGGYVRGTVIVRNRSFGWINLDSGVPIASVLAVPGTHRPATGCHVYAGVGLEIALAPFQEWKYRADDYAVRDNCAHKQEPLEPGTYEFVAPVEISGINGNARYEGRIWSDPVAIQVVP
jgi:hypothetical protein